VLREMKMTLVEFVLWYNIVDMNTEESIVTHFVLVGVICVFKSIWLEQNGDVPFP